MAVGFLSRLVLNKFIQEVRSANGGTLNPLTYDDVINRVAQLILDHQENMRVRVRYSVVFLQMFLLRFNNAVC